MKSPHADQHRAPPPRRPPPSGPEDAVADALLRAAAHGDLAALGALYDQTAPTVYGLLRGVLQHQGLAEQATQRVYLHLWRDAPRFDPATGSAYALLIDLARRELTPHLNTVITGAAGPVPPERR